MNQRIKTNEAAANQSGRMQARDHRLLSAFRLRSMTIAEVKNGANPKSQTSRRNMRIFKAVKRNAAEVQRYNECFVKNRKFS
jgi:hypothetical protein